MVNHKTTNRLTRSSSPSCLCDLKWRDLSWQSWSHCTGWCSGPFPSPPKSSLPPSWSLVSLSWRSVGQELQKRATLTGRFFSKRCVFCVSDRFKTEVTGMFLSLLHRKERLFLCCQVGLFEGWTDFRYVISKNSHVIPRKRLQYRQESFFVCFFLVRFHVVLNCFTTQNENQFHTHVPVYICRFVPVIWMFYDQ